MRWLLVLALAGCLQQPTHRCEAVDDCSADAICVIATGQSVGLCADLDAACGSGLRYADDAGGQAGVCVGEGDAPRAFQPCLVQPAVTAVDECATAVCTFEPRCCQDQWDEICIQLAEEGCDAHCGQVAAFAGDDELTVGRWDGSDFGIWFAADVTGHHLTGVSWGDYDFDLRADLVTCEDGSEVGDAIRIWHNEVDNFSLARTVVTSLNCLDVDWVDVDGDGDVDVVAGGPTDTVLVENDSGLFADPVSAVVGGFVVEMAWAQLGGDARLDVAVARYESSLVVRGNDDTFLDLYATSDSQRWDFVSWGDVTGDGALDLLATGDGILRVMENTAGEGFAPSSTPLFELTTDDLPASALFDADRDGDLDIIALGLDSPLRIYRNDDGDGFTPTPLWSSITEPFTLADDASMVLGDASGDGFTDVIACAPPDGCRMWVGDGAGQLTPQWNPDGTRSIRDVAVTGEW